jgi:putative phosphoesterase
MRLLILSDIHSNFVALQTVLEDAKQYIYDKIACCGDLVGYGPDPESVINWAISEKEKGGIFVSGNHDTAISDYSNLWGYNDSAHKSILIHRKMVSPASKLFLKSLSTKITFEDIMFIHGSPSKWDEYLCDSNDAEYNFAYIQGNICFIGHTHKSAIYRDTRGDPKIVNVGSVGQPRDGNPMACYCIFDTASREIKINRCNYDIIAVQNKMKEIQIPDRLIQRLQLGR